MSNKCPCKDCLDRRLFCHSMCRCYKSWAEEEEKKQAAKRAEREFLRPLPRKNLVAWWKKLKGRT